MPLTKSKNQYTKNRNGKKQGDVAKVFLINNTDVDSVINSISLMGKMYAKWFDHSPQRKTDTMQVIKELKDGRLIK